MTRSFGPIGPIGPFGPFGNRGTAAMLLALSISAGSAVADPLYSESTYRPLTADNKAFRVGDLLTVQVFENSSATASTDKGTHRSSNSGAQVGLTGTKASGTTLGGNANVAIGLSGDFDGGGSTQRSNRVLATLTVSVLEVRPSGELKVAGEQQLTVNEERQKVTVEGIVRPQDISDTNVVMSTRIAEARIVYIGEGDLSTRQKRSWWNQLSEALGF